MLSDGAVRRSHRNEFPAASPAALVTRVSKGFWRCFWKQLEFCYKYDNTYTITLLIIRKKYIKPKRLYSHHYYYITNNFYHSKPLIFIAFSVLAHRTFTMVKVVPITLSCCAVVSVLVLWAMTENAIKISGSILITHFLLPYFFCDFRVGLFAKVVHNAED